MSDTLEALGSGSGIFLLFGVGASRLHGGGSHFFPALVSGLFAGLFYHSISAGRVQPSICYFSGCTPIVFNGRVSPLLIFIFGHYFRQASVFQVFKFHSHVLHLAQLLVLRSSNVYFDFISRICLASNYFSNFSVTCPLRFYHVTDFSRYCWFKK
jgi:hypothetical protein